MYEIFPNILFDTQRSDYLTIARMLAARWGESCGRAGKPLFMAQRSAWGPTAIILMLKLAGRCHPGVDSDSPLWHQVNCVHRVNWSQLRLLSTSPSEFEKAEGETWAETIFQCAAHPARTNRDGSGARRPQH